MTKWSVLNDTGKLLREKLAFEYFESQGIDLDLAARIAAYGVSVIEAIIDYVESGSCLDLLDEDDKETLAKEVLVEAVAAGAFKSAKI